LPLTTITNGHEVLCRRLEGCPVNPIPERFLDDIHSQRHSHVKAVRICGLRRYKHVVEREMNPARRLVIDGQCPSVSVGCQFFESIVVQRLAISILDLAQLLASQELQGEAVNIRTAGNVMRPEQRVELKTQQG